MYYQLDYKKLVRRFGNYVIIMGLIKRMKISNYWNKIIICFPLRVVGLVVMGSILRG